MAKASKFYVVWKGATPGVYDNWADAKRQIDGFAAALYKSYPTENEALSAYQMGPRALQAGPAAAPKPTRANVGKPQKGAIAVDAACNMQTGVMEYQGVDIDGKVRLFHQGPFAGGTNNVGEYLALVHALAYCQKHAITAPIYSDSMTALAWLRKKKHGSKLEATAQNKTLFDLLARADSWLATNRYTNDVLKWETDFWGENPADFGRK
jgi:ribonuclease HI